jgi:phosphoglycolate phosphatase-like HAD superfamily hydrolase
MIRRCLEEMSIEAGRAVYVGDMVLDVETAARAGIPVLLVAGGSSNERDLRATRQTLLDSFQELLDLLPGSSGL